MTTHKQTKHAKPTPIRRAARYDPTSARLKALESVVTSLDTALRHAIERKPNVVLTRLVYELKMTRVELAAVQEQLAANNVILNRYVSAPALLAAAATQ
jgi:hypothetical protein